MKIESTKALPESGECTANLQSRLGPYGLLQDYPNLRLGTAPMLGGAQAQRAMRLVG
jgi:hypothetical protein